MKVLFAVNDENISTSIVKKYQKQYKEIISYKNVYYFNAILKELQRNKNYDRVVISEDLEEFTSSSLEQKDKFIFDRLDNISDEAVASDGSDIPIILICSERRSKSEDILVKLFGIGIYNAIIGEDRSVEEICRLINKPRSKKEAKIYYKIDSENVNYEKESESDVSEIEMQNILMHFKKLGKNEERYAESFKNIVSQYTDAQLKVIIAVLPNNVKAVLEETSPEYQRIMYAGGKVAPSARSFSRSRNESIKKVKKNNGTSEKLLDVDNNNTVMSKPVVVPTAMEKSMYKKVDTKKKVDLEELEDEEDNDMLQEEIVVEKPKRRGRPRKNPLPEQPIQEEEKPKRRGRPRKNPLPEETDTFANILSGFDEDEDEEEEEPISNIRSNKKVARTNTILPGFEEEEEEENEEDLYEEDQPDDEYEIQYEDEDEDNDAYEEEPIRRTNIRQARPQYQEDRNFQTEDQLEYKQELKQYDNVFDEEEYSSLLTSDKKVAAFVGTSKNGTSFIINNVAQILSNMGINTAILDATQNKNSYYIYTKNNEELRRTATDSIKNLINGAANGIQVNNNLTVYTGFPTQQEEICHSRPILETLLQNHSLILIDCDFHTPVEYFDKSQELYLVQSMDVLTIQPLTEFLRELQIKDLLDESKIRIILNKLLKIKRVNGTAIIGGMSKYNNPDLSLMKDLFNAKTVRVAAQIPFDEDVYAKYLEDLIDCEIKLNGYPKEFRTQLNMLSEVIYPLLPNKNQSKNKKNKKEAYNNSYSNSFSSDMNHTLDNMRKKY